MHWFGRRRSWFLSKLTSFGYWILHGFLAFVQNRVVKQKNAALTDRLRWASFASKSHRNELLYIYFVSIWRLEIEPGSLISSAAMPREEWKCKHQKASTQGSKQGPTPLLGPLKKTPKSFARLIGEPTWKNLTLWDWMTVHAYVDTLPQPMKQNNVVKYFATRPEGPLIFTTHTITQITTVLRDGSMSDIKPQCIIKQMTTHCHEAWCGSCIVAGGLAHGAEVNSVMLVAKWAVFEKALDVPEDERLTELNQGGFNHSVECEWTLNWPNWSSCDSWWVQWGQGRTPRLGYSTERLEAHFWWALHTWWAFGSRRGVGDWGEHLFIWRWRCWDCRGCTTGALRGHWGDWPWWWSWSSTYLHLSRRW